METLKHNQSMILIYINLHQGQYLGTKDTTHCIARRRIKGCTRCSRSHPTPFMERNYAQRVAASRIKVKYLAIRYMYNRVAISNQTCVAHECISTSKSYIPIAMRACHLPSLSRMCRSFLSFL